MQSRCTFTSQGRLRCTSEHQDKVVAVREKVVEPVSNRIRSKALATRLVNAADMEPFVDSSTKLCGSSLQPATVFPELQGKIVRWLAECDISAPASAKKYSIAIGHKTTFSVTKYFGAGSPEVKEYFRTKDNATYVIPASIMDTVFNADTNLVKISFDTVEASGKVFQDIDGLDLGSKTLTLPKMSLPVESVVTSKVPVGTKLNIKNIATNMCILDGAYKVAPCTAEQTMTMVPVPNEANRKGYRLFGTKTKLAIFDAADGRRGVFGAWWPDQDYQAIPVAKRGGQPAYHFKNSVTGRCLEVSDPNTGALGVNACAPENDRQLWQ